MNMEGKISLKKAATMARITYRGALEELKKRNIPFRYEKKDMDVDIQWPLYEDARKTIEEIK